jgi:predicted CXXCH cytochrome family protein
MLSTWMGFQLTYYRRLSPLWLLLLLVYPAAAQQIDTANGTGRGRTVSIFDEIQDAQERSLFKKLWDAENPQQARQRAVDFVEHYPRSVLLREAYEQAARASESMGDNNGALEWGKRALRLLPENPFLLAMMADLAARQGQHQLAETSGRQALQYLERALAPTTVSPADWPQVRSGLRNLAFFALGRTALEQAHYEDAERWLLEALRLKPTDYVALYALGVSRYERKDPDSAAPCFAEVMKAAGGALGEAGRQRLHQVYGAKTRSQTFEEFAASQHWSVPPAAPTSAASPPGAYAGSAACRQCHPSEFRNWQSTGMAKMFRPYSAGDVMGRFSGEEIVGGSARTSAENDRHFIELRNEESGKWTRYRVDALIGSKWQQAYASLLPDGQLVVLPIQYSKVEGGWVNYWKIVDGSSERSDIGHFQGAPEGSLYQRDCAPCHTSQLRLGGAGASPTTAQFREGGVDCEMCHGPSQAHVDVKRGGSHAGPRAPSSIEAPVSFRKIPAEQSVAICGQCHKQSQAYEPDAAGVVNYSQAAAPFYRTYSSHLLSDYSHKVFYADGRFRVTTFIGEAFERSRCFRKGGATCVSCHNPHPDDPASNQKSLKFAPDSDEMCLQCHQSLREHPEGHTRHAPASEASRCVSCHMPRNMEALLFRARSHQIDEIPDAEMTARFGESDSPNACLACHRGKDARWLVDSMQAWQPGR